MMGMGAPQAGYGGYGGSMDGYAGRGMAGAYPGGGMGYGGGYGAPAGLLGGLQGNGQGGATGGWNWGGGGYGPGGPGMGTKGAGGAGGADGLGQSPWGWSHPGGLQEKFGGGAGAPTPGASGGSGAPSAGAPNAPAQAAGGAQAAPQFGGMSAQDAYKAYTANPGANAALLTGMMGSDQGAGWRAAMNAGGQYSMGHGANGQPGGQYVYGNIPQANQRFSPTA